MPSPQQQPRGLYSLRHAQGGNRHADSSRESAHFVLRSHGKQPGQAPKWGAASSMRDGGHANDFATAVNLEARPQTARASTAVWRDLSPFASWISTGNPSSIPSHPQAFSSSSSRPYRPPPSTRSPGAPRRPPVSSTLPKVPLSQQEAATALLQDTSSRRAVDRQKLFNANQKFDDRLGAAEERHARAEEELRQQLRAAEAAEEAARRKRIAAGERRSRRLRREEMRRKAAAAAAAAAAEHAAETDAPQDARQDDVADADSDDAQARKDDDAESSSSEAEIDEPEEEDEFTGLLRYTELQPLLDWLQSGDVALVRASYLLRLAARPEGRLPRRQDLPAEALVDGPMLARVAYEIREWESYAKHPKYVDDLELMRFPPIVAVSYAWSGREHPDADGKQLKEVLAPAVKWYMSERARWIQPGTRIMPDVPRIASDFTADGCDFGLFVDYCSLFQTPRDAPAQEEAFQRALQSMEMPFGHKLTCVWRMTRRLEGQEHATYAERGWPLFETCVSFLLTPENNCLHLGTDAAADALLSHAEFDEEPIDPEEMLYGANYFNDVSSGTFKSLKDKRADVRADSVGAFENLVKTKLFAESKDKELVTLLFQQITSAIKEGVRSMMKTRSA